MNLISIIYSYFFLHNCCMQTDDITLPSAITAEYAGFPAEGLDPYRQATYLISLGFQTILKSYFLYFMN